MRFPATEIPYLPAPAALLDFKGGVEAHTPEWVGATPGTVYYRIGRSSLLVAPEDSDPAADALIVRLLDVLRRGAQRMPDVSDQLNATMLAAGLAVSAGHPVDHVGSLAAVRAFAAAGLERRSMMEITWEGSWDATEVVGPEVIALALVQMAVNVETHAEATDAVISCSYGPTFKVRAGAAVGSASIETSRAAGNRQRWGAAYCRHLADALGGSIASPYQTDDGFQEVSLGLGSSRIAVPAAVIRDGTIADCTQAFTEETSLHQGDPLSDRLGGLQAAALREQGRIVTRYPFKGRASGEGTWVMVTSNEGTDRIREVVNGLAHEVALWAGAQEPERTQGYALSWILSRALGGEWEPILPEAWAKRFPDACGALGIPVAAWPEGHDRMPDAHIAAFLLAELGGWLESAGSDVVLVHPTTERSALGLFLDPETTGTIRLT